MHLRDKIRSGSKFWPGLVGLGRALGHLAETRPDWAGPGRPKIAGPTGPGRAGLSFLAGPNSRADRAAGLGPALSVGLLADQQP